MKTLRIYLIACALMESTVAIHSAEIDPAILAESRRLEEARQEQEALAESHAFEESRRLAAQPKKSIAPQAKTRVQEQEELELALAISRSEADEQERKDREHKAREQAERERKRRAELEHDRLLAQQEQEAEHKKHQHDRDRKKRAEEEATEAFLRREQEQLNQEAVQRITDQDRQKHEQERRNLEAAQRVAAEERRRELKRRAEEDEKRREAAERKREAEHPIRGFTTKGYTVHPQTGAACGLYAIDNGNKCFNALRDGKSAELERILMTGLSPEANAVKNKDMLDGVNIQEVAGSLHMDPRCYSFLENILQGKDELLKPFPQTTDKIFYIPHSLGTGIEALRTQPHALHVFIIANTEITQTAEHNPHWGRFGKKDDHWIAIVAEKKDGIITFHYMDTGSSNSNADFINTLQEIIMRGNYYGLQLAAELHEYHTAAINVFINKGEYRRVLEHIQKQISLANKIGVINDAQFPKDARIDQLKTLHSYFESLGNERECIQIELLLNKLR